jgi:hypothetical protein
MGARGREGVMPGTYTKKLIAEIERHQQQGDEPEVLATIRRPGPIEVPQDVAPSVFAWMRAYQYLVKIAAGIMGSETLAEFAEFVAEADDDFLPHGPPDSPITESFFFGWWAIDRTIHGGDESIAKVAAELAAKYGGAEEEIARIRTLADTHVRVVKIEERSGANAKLRDLVTDEVIEVGLAAAWDGDAGQLWLARAVPDMCFTPYALDHAEQEWREYFERTLGDVQGDELARRYREHMRGDPTSTWLEYILDGYDGGNQHTLRLAGVPDRPETLPHGPEQFSLVDAFPPSDDPRDRMMRELFATDLLMEALGDFMQARESFELPEIEPDEDMLLDPLLLAYAGYGIQLEDGKTFLEGFVDDPPGDMKPEDLEDLRATRAGWFSLFEVLHVRLDEGMELKDLLRNKKIWIDEKSATRQVALGDVLGGWIQDFGGRLMLEGANLHFPRMFADPVKAFMRDYYKSLPKMPWRERLASTVPVVWALHENLRERPPVPKIVNEDGEEIVFSQGRYLLKADITAKLTAAGWEGDEDSFVLLDVERLLASVEIDGERATLFATSPKDLQMAKVKFQADVGADAVHQTDVFEDAQVAVGERMARGEEEDVEELPPEVQAELRQHMMEELNAWLDTKVPMLGNKTPRQACRTERGKEDVKMMLLEQERILEAQSPLDEPLDFEPLWVSLGLEYPK